MKNKQEFDESLKAQVEETITALSIQSAQLRKNGWHKEAKVNDKKQERILKRHQKFQEVQVKED